MFWRYEICNKGSCGQHYSCFCRLIIWSSVNHGYHKVLVLCGGLLKLTISYNSDNEYLAPPTRCGGINIWSIGREDYNQARMK